jgi:WD40 repeat protein
MSFLNVTKLSHFSGHKDAIYALCAGLNENEFYSGAGDGMIVSWNHARNVDGKLIVQVNRPVYSLYLDKVEQLLYCGTAAGNLHIIDLKNNQEIRNIEAHQKGLFDIQCINNDVITAGGDGAICVWEKGSMLLKKQLLLSDKSARCVTTATAQNKFMVGYSDFMVRTFDAAHYTFDVDVLSHQNSVFSVAYQAQNNCIISGGRDAMLNVFSISSNQLLHSIPAHTLHINHIQFNLTANWFSTVSMDKTIKIWDAQTYQLLKVIDFARNKGHVNSVNKCLWIDENKLISCGDDKAIMIWQIEANKE